LQAEIVTIGTELLLGEIVDTNSAWIAQQLTTIGLNLFYTTTVGDNLGRITDVLQRALDRCDVVITTGGLGPTLDDMTREAVANATDRELYLDEELLEEIRAYFGQRRFQMTSNNNRQAELPRGAEVIHNPVGTAPAFSVEHNGKIIISLPGVPHEMRYLMEHEVLPLLGERYGLRSMIKSRVLRTCGIGESAVGALIVEFMELSNPTVGTRAHPGQTDVCITAKADTDAEAELLIAPVEAKIRELLGDRIFGTDQQTMADVVSQELAERGQRVAVLENTSQGELAQQLTRAAAAGAWAGGLVVADRATLERALGSDPLPEGNGASARDALASQEMADFAAQALCERMGADYGLAILGPADPADPAAPDAYFALQTPNGLVRSESRRAREGAVGRAWLVHLGLDMIRQHVLELSRAS
jgi:nicotinamide-nucleotide amidase